jgi:hypothetical protein
MAAARKRKIAAQVIAILADPYGRVLRITDAHGQKFIGIEYSTGMFLLDLPTEPN